MKWKLVGLAIYAVSVTGQTAETCSLTLGDLVEEIQLQAGSQAKRAQDETEKFNAGKDRAILDEPLSSPDSTQINGPPEQTGEDPVADAAFPGIIGLAIGTPITETDEGALSLDLTPFSIVAAHDPDAVSLQSEYQKHELLRRFGLNLTLGGKGQARDTDGDGMVEDAPSSNSLTDVVSTEFRWRFWGSRDRRDSKNWQGDGEKWPGYFGDKELFQSLNEASEAWASVANGAASIVNADPNKKDYYCQEDVTRFLEALSTQHSVDERMANYLEARRKALERIDGAPIATLVAGLTEFDQDFGDDRWWVGIRGAGSLGDKDQGWTLNLDYGETDFAGTDEDASRVKFGLEYASLVAKSWAKPGLNPPRFSLSAAYERWSDVPAEADDKIYSVNAKWSYQVTETISIPLSVTWANRDELLQGESTVRGHIGFTFDIDQALLGKSK